MITKFKIFEKSAEEIILFDWQKISTRIKEKLPYKEGEYVEVHVGTGGEPPSGRLNDIHDIFQIIFVRYYDKNQKIYGDNPMVTYGVLTPNDDIDNYFEVIEDNIVRKVPIYEVEANKYNL